tara:strand:- start:165 stop:368 length:204 start_codon:yes stop_codon:yes gene_type:complete
MSKKKLFYKAIIWQIIGITWISLFSYFWFGSLSRSIIFSIIVMIISVFIYVLYEIIWNKLSNKNEKN